MSTIIENTALLYFIVTMYDSSVYNVYYRNKTAIIFETIVIIVKVNIDHIQHYFELYIVHQEKVYRRSTNRGYRNCGNHCYTII